MNGKIWPARPWEPATLKDYAEYKRWLWVQAGGDDQAPITLTWHDGYGLKHAGQVEYVNAGLNKLNAVQKDGDRYALILALFGDYGNIDPEKPSTKDLRKWQASFLVDWIGAMAANGYTPLGVAQVEAARLLGQLDLFALTPQEAHAQFVNATRIERPRTPWVEEV